MANFSLPNNASTVVLAQNTGVKKHGLWVQNFNTGTGIYLEAGDVAGANSFYIPPAAGATSPSSFIIQSTGNDTTLVNAEWRAFQNSGGAVNIKLGRW